MARRDHAGIRRHYRVLAVLGEGGFGKVYLARDLSAGGIERYAALKVLRSDARVRDEQRFRDEATILSMLEHPSFVRVNALFRVEGRWAFDMEYVRGATLDRVLGVHASLPPAAALELTLQVAEALDMAWAHVGPSGKPLHVMHRDIKPSNLLLTRGGVVKVLDFGIARWEAAPREAETATRLPASVGYMAPERFGFSADFGPEADVYALGAVLWEMLVGEPYLLPGAVDPTRKTNPEWMSRYASERGARLAELGLPGSLVALLDDMLAPEPADRPTAAAVVERCGDVAADVGRGGEARAWVRAELRPILDRLPQGSEGDGWCGRELHTDPLPSPPDGRATAYRFLPPLSEAAAAQSTLVPSTPTQGPWPPPTTQGAAARWVALGGVAMIGLIGALWLGLRDPDGDGDGSPDRADCAPTDPLRHPGAEERCDGVDQDCDGEVDEGLSAVTLFRDRDGDGFGAGTGEPGCQTSRAGYASVGGDCDDDAGRVSPGATELPGNGVDDDCDPSTPDERPAATVKKSAGTPAASASTAPAVATAPAAPSTGRVSVSGAATTVTLSGERTLTLKPDKAEDVPAGKYVATLKGELTSTTLELNVPAGGSVVFDCRRPSMGRLCQVSTSGGRAP